MRVSPCGCVFHSFSQFNNEIVLFLLLLYSQLLYLFFWGFFFRVFQLLFFNPFSELLLSIYFSLFSFFFFSRKVYISRDCLKKIILSTEVFSKRCHDLCLRRLRGTDFLYTFLVFFFISLSSLHSFMLIARILHQDISLICYFTLSPTLTLKWWASSISFMGYQRISSNNDLYFPQRYRYHSFIILNEMIN